MTTAPHRPTVPALAVVAALTLSALVASGACADGSGASDAPPPATDEPAGAPNGEGADSVGAATLPSLPPAPDTVDTVEEVHAWLTERLIDAPGVTALGIATCDGNPCVKVYVVRIDASVRRSLPRSVGGIPIDVEASGRVRGGGNGA